jgi:hypothetical protein
VDQSTLDEMKQVCDSLAATLLLHLPFCLSIIAQPRSCFFHRPFPLVHHG